MRFLDWLIDCVGRDVDVDRAYGPQCTDLVNDYLLRVWSQGPLPGNATDFQRARLRGWLWEPNTPYNRPPTGAVVVWSGPDGTLDLSVYGHTAVALLSDLHTILTVDQNWPAGHNVQQVYHHYVSVAGWHRPPVPVLDHLP